MKKFIKLTGLMLLACAGVFASGPAKPGSHKVTTPKAMVSFSTLPSKRGLEIMVDKNVTGKAIVTIYNYENDVVWRDALSKKRGTEKAFILNELDNGNYTVEVSLNKQNVRKIAHVYYKGDSKLVSLRG
jgi:hypothetical protein